MARAARELRGRIEQRLAREDGRGPLTRVFHERRAASGCGWAIGEFADLAAQTLVYGLFAERVAPAGAPRSAAVVELDGFVDEDVRRVIADADVAGVDSVYFYEQFLAAYDPRARARRGVFYTPGEIVEYIVGAVDARLREELGLADGLADTTSWGELARRRPGLVVPAGVSPAQAFVQILDPATGTGIFLIGVVDRVHRTMLAKWAGRDAGAIAGLWQDYVQAHLLPRLHGFELSPVAHALARHQLALKLHATGYRGAAEVQVYRADALEMASGALDELVGEARAAEAVKRSRRFTVVLGNPPYSGASVNRSPWIEREMERYKSTVRAQERQIQRLSNDYVKFMRLAEWAVMRAGAGVVGVITDRGWLEGILFRDMRAALLETFDRLRVLDLHGEAREEENVFEIVQGVAISLWTRAPGGARMVEYAALQGTRAEKLAGLGSADWRSLRVSGPAYRLVPAAADGVYDEWTEFLQVIGTGVPGLDRDRRYGTGVKTRHDAFVIGWDAADAVRRVAQVAGRSEGDEELVRALGLCTTAHFSPARARERAEAGDLARHVRTICFRPFDARSLVYLREFVCEPKRETMRHMEIPGNLAMAVLRRDRSGRGAGYFVARGLVAKDLVSSRDDALVWPLYVQVEERVAANLAAGFIERLCWALGLGWIERGGGDLERTFGPEDVFAYMYAVFHSPGYRTRHADALRQEFPRVPLPGGVAVFRGLVGLGRALVGAHLLEAVERGPARYVGGARPRVGKVAWSDDTVWLDGAAGDGFRGVTADVWGFHVGGHAVCEKWLRDRRGRTLAAGEVEHYEKIVAAVAATIRWMRAIDELVDRSGGWPGAFQGR